jgi:hypothetical protein
MAQTVARPSEAAETEVTRVLRSGPPGAKRNVAVLGDGFAAGDQAAFDQWVDDVLLDGVFGNDYFEEDAQAFNVYRVNLVSNESGASVQNWDDQGTPSDADDVLLDETIRDTALGYISNASWNRGWFDSSPDSADRLQTALDEHVPDYDFVLVVLNTTRFGGLRIGNRMWVTIHPAMQGVTAHEFGHGFGNLADEYCRPGTHSGGEPSRVNVTADPDRATTKWRKFIDPATPVPTGLNGSCGNGRCTDYNQGVRPSDWSVDQDAGMFEGARYRDCGLYRPAENCRMRSGELFCPVCYTEMKRIHHPYTGRTFRNTYAGDFDGDGRDDVLVHNDNGIQLFRSDGSQLDHVFSAVERVPGSWQFTAGDQFYVGDFDGDGKDEVVVYNGTNWSIEYLGLLADDGDDGLRLVARYDDRMPGWQFGRNDQFFVGDFDGDGRDDLYVFNGDDWSVGYLGMLRSTGGGFQLARRYDRRLPSWHMTGGDQFFVGDFDGDGRDDLYVFNGDDWSVGYLGMLASDGGSLTMRRRYDEYLPSWYMAEGDRYYVGDFDGDGRDDLYVFNGSDWSRPWLGMLASDGSSLAVARRYDDSAPGWTMREHDRHYVGDVNGDGKADLFVYNHEDWSREYLGTMTSSGAALSCAWREDWVGEWNLGSVDEFIACNYEGTAGKRDLLVFNENWFGMIRATPTLSLQRIYYKWIHNYRHGRNW